MHHIKNFFRTIQYNRGQVALASVFFFIMIGFVVMTTFVYIARTQINTANDFLASKRTYATAESGAEDIAYRLKTAKAYASPSLVLNGGTVAFTVAGSGSGPFTITSRGKVGDRNRSVRAVVTKGAGSGGFSSNNAMGIGFVGLRFNDSPTVQHVDYPAEAAEVFSNGSIDAGQATNILVRGNMTNAQAIANDSAWAQCNPREAGVCVDTPTAGWASWPPVQLGRVSTQMDLAQAFVPSVTAFGVRVRLYMRRVGTGTANTIHLRLMANSSVLNKVGGSPNESDASTYQLSPREDIDTGEFADGVWKWHEEVFTGGSADRYLVEGEKYWIVMDVQGSAKATDYWEIKAIPYASGYAPQGVLTGPINYPACYGASCGSRSDRNNASAWDPSILLYSDNAATTPPTYHDFGTDGVIDASDLTAAFQFFPGEETRNNADTRFATRITHAEIVKVGVLPNTGVMRGDEIYGISTAKESTTNGEMHYGFAQGTEVRVNGATCTNSSPPVGCNIIGGATPPNVLPQVFMANSGGSNVTIKKWIYDLKTEASQAGSGADVTVSAGQTILLQPGRYGKLTMSGNNAKLILKTDVSGPLMDKYLYYFQNTTMDNTISCTNIQTCGIYLDLDGTQDPPVTPIVIFNAPIRVTDGGPEIVGCNIATFAGCNVNTTKNDVYLLSSHGPLDYSTTGGREAAIYQDRPGAALKQRGAAMAPFGFVHFHDYPIVSQIIAAEALYDGNGTVTYKKGNATSICPGVCPGSNIDYTEFHEIE